jgi:hypothetical protein
MSRKSATSTYAPPEPLVTWTDQELLFHQAIGTWGSAGWRADTLSAEIKRRGLNG